jgi:hypothetical protein
MAAMATGGADDIDVGWRKAIRIAMTESPTCEEATTIRAKHRLPPEERPPLPLLDER